jgi:hypothetical protein
MSLRLYFAALSLFEVFLLAEAVLDWAMQLDTL